MHARNNRAVMIYFSEEDYALLTEVYGSQHGLAGRLRSELMAVARARAAKRSASNTVPTPKPEPKKSDFLSEVFKKYGQ